MILLLRLTKDERELLYKKNLESFYTFKQNTMEPSAFQKLKQFLTEDMLRGNLDADLSKHLITDDYSDIYQSKYEQLKLFCYDKDKLLISSSVIAIGDEGTVPFDYNSISKQITADKNIAYYSLIHNHPMAYGAVFSQPDKNMAFCCARLGELLNVFLLDFIVVTPYDAVSLFLLERNQPLGILDFKISESQFGEQSLLAFSPYLHNYLNLLSNKKRLADAQEYQYLPTDKKDMVAIKKLLSRLLAHADGSLREESLKEIEDELNKWK